LKDYGYSVQRSVFECDLDDAVRLTLERRLTGLIEEQIDSIRLYRLCASCAPQTRVLGRNKSEKPGAVEVI
jgi:CRISPR-associated protein Cas2